MNLWIAGCTAAAVRTPAFFYLFPFREMEMEV